MSSPDTVEVKFPKNSATRMGLIALFREAKEVDEDHDRNLFPDDVQQAHRKIYDNIAEIEDVTLTVEFEG